MADFVREFPIPRPLAAPLRAALRGEPDAWPRLSAAEVRTLVEHGIAPLVYAAARVPELRDEAIRAAALETRREADLREVLGALAARGVELLLLKGTALAYELYAAPELRPRGDTDLLVRRESMGEVRAALTALGFREHDTSGDEHALHQTLFTRGGHAYDVHWKVTNHPLFAYGFYELFARSRTIAGLGRTLSHEDALLLACVHRVLHHHDSERLIWLADIALLRDAMTRDEHERFWRMAAADRAVQVSARSIALADAWFSRAPRHGAEEWLSDEERTRDERSSVFLDRELTNAGVLLASLHALPWRARMQRLRQLAFPPAKFMRARFGSGKSLPLLYVRRGARGVLRLFRRAAE
ncbi:MAG TPA: nucleotidyltransferase family protein [Thermoanaerobaculia bacterium]|jgi:hypothetical protein